MRMRTASSILVGVAAVLLVVSPVRPDVLTSAVTDPVGDLNASLACEGFNCQPYQDMALAEITSARNCQPIRVHRPGPLGWHAFHRSCDRP